MPFLRRSLFRRRPKRHAERCDNLSIMKEGPTIAAIAALLGDPGRANMLAALMQGRALTATELATEAGVTPQTASGHLALLLDGGLVQVQRQGRHRYYRLFGPDVALVIEGLMTLAGRAGHLRTRPGPKDEALRRARVCFDHLAGAYGVCMFDSLVARGYLAGDGGILKPSEDGRRYLAAFGIDMAALERTRRPLCRECLDWSVRRPHLAGGLGAALLARIVTLGWAERQNRSRIVAFSGDGEQRFLAEFGK